MKCQTPRMMIAGTNSGCGKTTVVCGILSALQQMKKQIVSCKCGPDYIDPMFHRQILGVDTQNLDLYFSSPEEMRYLLAEHVQSADIAVIEGVMGYYDGNRFESTQASSYEVAKETHTPTVLVVSAKGMAQSVLALLQGFLTFQPDHTICGVILNGVSAMTGQKLSKLIEERFGIRVYGCIPKLDKIQFASRHLGLVTPQEIEEIKQDMQTLGKLFLEYVDMNGLCELAKGASDYEAEQPIRWKQTLVAQAGKKSLQVTVARDVAFSFYYKENLQLLEQCGCTLQYFSPLTDEKLLENTDLLLLGGGYPELYAKQLSENAQMRESIRNYLTQGGCCLAECGGFMYLLEQMADDKETIYPMVGYLKGSSANTGHLVCFGYQELTANKQDAYLYPGSIKAHEFHYWDSTNNGNTYHAVKPSGKRSWDCIHTQRGQILGYPHLYYYANVEMIGKFLDDCRKVKEERESCLR